MMPKIFRRYTQEEHQNVWIRPRGPGRPSASLQPYLNIINELQESPTLTVELENTEETRTSKQRLQRAAKETHGKGLIFQRIHPDSRELTFRLQTDDERSHFHERGMMAASALDALAKQGKLKRGRKTS